MAAWLIPTIIHGLYDYCLMAASYTGSTEQEIEMIFLAIVIFIISLAIYTVKLLNEINRKSIVKPKQSQNLAYATNNGYNQNMYQQPSHEEFCPNCGTRFTANFCSKCGRKRN